MNIFLKKILLLVSFLVLGLVIFCSGEKKVIKVGIALPLTGDVSSYGISTKNGVELAFLDSNLAAVELITEDSKCTEEGAVEAANKLIDVDKVVAIIGALCSRATLAMAPVVEQNKVVLISPASTNPDITDAGEYVFRTIPTDFHQGFFSASVVREEEIKRLAIIYPNSSYGKGLSKVLEEAFVDQEGKVVASENFPVEGSNAKFESELKRKLKKIKRAKPEALFIISDALSRSVSIVKAINKYRLKARLFAAETLYSKEIAALKGAEGLVVIVNSLGTEEFKDAYLQEYGEDPGTFSAQAYDAYKVVAQALRGSAKTGEEVKNAFEYIDIIGALGKEVKFDENGDVSGSYDVYQVINGDFVVR